MNMKFTNVLIGLLVVCAACSSEKETPSGLKFTVVKSGDGILPKKEEILVFDYILRDSKDSVWHSTYDDGLPAAAMINDSSALKDENGMVQMFRMVSKGDSVRFSLPVAKFFQDIVKRPPPPGIDTTLTLSYGMNVTHVMSRDSFENYQVSLMKKKMEAQKGKDDRLIKKYLEDNKIAAVEDTSGIYYVVHQTKGGAKPAPDNCVKVRYSGKFMKNGQQFDKNEIAFPLNNVIQGWKYAIPMLGVGDSATFYIPSGLAYGPQGYPGAIPPDAILIFDVALLNFGTEYDRATQACK